MTFLRGESNKYVRIWFAISCVFIIIIAGLIVSNVRTNIVAEKAQHAAAAAKAATVQAKNAAREAQNTANCVNNVLGTRAAVTVADNNAHIDFAEALLTVLETPPTATQTQQKAAVVLFIKALSKYVDTLVADQKYRNQHPLGHC